MNFWLLLRPDARLTILTTLELELELLSAVWGAAHKSASLVRGPVRQHPAVTSRFYPGFCPELPFFWVLVPGSNPGFSLGDFFREWPKGGTKGVLLPDRVFFTFSWVSADPEPNPVPGRISTPVPNPGFEPRFGPGSGRSGFWFPLRRKPGSPENPEGGR